MPMTDSLHTAKPVEAYPYCKGKKVIRKGVRKKKYGNIQLYYCQRCEKKFTPLVTKHKTFPLRVIMYALTLYNRLYTLEDAAKGATEKFGLSVSRQNVRNWLDTFSGYLPFLRQRSAAARLYERRRLILETRLFHRQVYIYKYHRAKMGLIVKNYGRFSPLEDFLENIPQTCPHSLFRQDHTRASAHKGRFDLDGVKIVRQQNLAVSSARFVLQAVAVNKHRHETLQDFMLTNDAATIAIEVPITLNAEDLAHFEELGYSLPFALPREGFITGHIDILQIRNGLIHILDYKPGARKVRPIEQLITYALALSRATGIRLNHFKCAWFDDEDYFEFYPRTVVEKKARGS